MTPLVAKIKARIAEVGPIPFAEYMSTCLFDPEYGYYANLQAIGSSGDFITAPELGPYFARALAHFLGPALQAFQHPVILELGGGTGQLAYDLLQALQDANSLPERYLIFEKSPRLKAVQQQKLKAFSGVQIEWCEDLQAATLEGILLANEFFDALPVERYVRREDASVEKTGVDYQGNQLIETGEGERFERCECLAEILTPILTAFKKGLALIIDYGEETIERSTLTAYYQHQIVSPFLYPGTSDLTADVDFTALAEVFLKAGWEIESLKPQHQFLLEQGILPATGIDPDRYVLKRLLDPRMMGERFKVMLSSKKYTFPAERDRSETPSQSNA